MTERIYNNVLLAEDDEDDRIFFSEALQNVLPRASLHVSPRGDVAMNLLKDSKFMFDIIFLDLNMPRNSGNDILEFIRNNESLKETIVVMLTTCNTFAHINDSYKLGANFYIVKPFSFTELSHFLKECFRRLDTYGTAQPPINGFLIKSES
ncbi:MAG: response regulator [Flavobacterium sp.]